MQLAPLIANRSGCVGSGKYDVERAVSMNVADLAAGDFTVGVDGGTHRDKCCVIVLFVVAVVTGQGRPGGDKRRDGEAGVKW